MSSSGSLSWKSMSQEDCANPAAASTGDGHDTQDDDLHAHYAASSVPSSTSYSFSGSDLSGAREVCSAPSAPLHIHANEKRACERSAGMSSASAPAENSAESSFDCNICLEVPSDPVITHCGHLFCWKCVYTWMDKGKCECPICKAFIAPDKMIPLYGHGRNHGTHAYHHRNTQNSTRGAAPSGASNENSSSATPPRPHAARTEAPPSQPSWTSSFQSFFEPSNWSASPFGATVGLGGGALTFGAGLGFFPSLFGLSFTYNPQPNHSHRNSQQHSQRNANANNGNRPLRQTADRQNATNANAHAAEDMNDAAFSRLIMFLALLLFFSVLLY